MKKIFVFLISVVLILTCNALGFAAYYEDTVNDGSSLEKAYIINSTEDFRLMRDRVNQGIDGKGKYYKLNSDIDITSDIEWVGIDGFNGYFDGQKHTINVNISRDYNQTGIFDEIYNSSTVIKNLNVVGTVRGIWAGGITWGLGAGTIENCSFTGTVEAVAAWAGGFVDLMTGGTIKNCVFNGKVISNTHSAGGVVAELYGGSVEGCTVISGSEMSGISYAGGIIGLMHGGSVKDCTTEVTLSKAPSKGGIVGGATTSVISNLSGNKWPNNYTQVGLVDDYLPNDPDEIEQKQEEQKSEIQWNNHTYQLYNENLTWEEAKARCEALGGHLLTITSQAEQNFIEDTLKSSSKSYDVYWLGAKVNESGWEEWVTDEVFEGQYENFADGQPNGSGNYFHIIANENENLFGFWGNTSDLDAEHGFICEWDKNETTAEGEIKSAPVADLFEEWQKNPDAWIDDSGTPTGAIPSPEDTSHLANNPPKVETGTLPASYDARKNNGLPPVRDQGKYQTCWAFAAIGAMEADYMAQKMTSLGTVPDLSELHLAWFTYKDPSLDYASLDHKVDSILDMRGDSGKAVALLSKVAKAPINETEMPYTVAGDDKTKTDSAIENFVKGKTFKSVRVSLKDTNNFPSDFGYINNNNVNVVKKAIMEHGAVNFSFMNVNSGYNADKTAFYSTTYDPTRLHAVLLVGWDDDYSVDNFAAQPPVKGAWLVRNSYGEKFGDGGYFWMSYAQADNNMSDLRIFIVREDKEIQENQTSEQQPLQVKGHDSNGKTHNITSAWSSGIFQSDRNESLIRVAFYTTDNNAKYEVFINNFGKLKPTDPGKAEAPILTGTIPYAGYHTVDLDTPINLYEGDYYSVIVKMTLDSSYSYPTAAETSLDKYAIAVVNEGENFFASGSPVPSLWVDGKNVQEGPFNACIKVFTVERTSNETKPEIITSALSSATVSKDYNFTLSATGSETIEWRSGTIPSGLALSRSGIITGRPIEVGDYEIKLLALNRVGIAETTLTLSVQDSDSNNSLSSSGSGCNFGLGAYCGVFALALFVGMRRKK